MSKFVTIACKLPHGLIIEVGTYGLENYRRVQLNGPNTLNPKTGKPASVVSAVGGYAFTQVPEDVWNEFVAKHKGAQYLKNRAVYCETTLEGAQAAALTDGNTKLGFEGLNPDAPVPGITPDSEHLKLAKASAANAVQVNS